MRINPETELFGIIGYPLTHSLSPMIHNRAFEESKINAIYLYLPCRDIKGVVPGMKSLSIKGLSVTIPHKEGICQHVDELDPLAEEIGAVNTLLNRDGHVVGYNTDAYGAIMPLKKELGSIKGRSVLVIGAGGAARAICFALKKEEAEITIVNRTKKRGQRLAQEIGARFYPLSEISNRGFDIIIQATSVGMYPDVDKMPVSKEILYPDAIVMDIVYNPLETRFLKEAKKIGCKVVPGIEMFIYQGVRQFELWTGRDAPIDIMRSTAISYLKGKEGEKGEKA